MDLNQLLINEGISLTTVLNSIPEGLMVINREGKLLVWNKAAEEMYGLKLTGNYQKELQSLQYFNSDGMTLLSVEDIPIFRALRGETIKDAKIFFAGHDNKSRYLSCNALPLVVDGIISGALATFHDITGRFQDELRSNHDGTFYQQILNAMPAFIFSKDLKGNLTFLNSNFKHKFSSTFGTTAEGFKQTPTEKELARSRDELVIASRLPLHSDEDFRNDVTGEKVYLRTIRIPMLNQSGNVYGISGISFDMTEEMNQKKTLEDERSKINHASKLAALGLMAAEIGHEINNPLAILKSSAWIVRRVITSKQFPESLAVDKLNEIDITIERITQIVKSLRNLSRDSSTDKMQSHPIHEILNDVQSICWPKFKPKGIEFLIDPLNPLLKRSIPCLRVQLSEVFINLLANAVDAVEFCQNPWVKMEILEQDQNIIFRVTDSGSGISEDIEPKIFNAFFSTKELGKGTGLGLSISKDIMKRQKGELRLNRTISASCFEVILPIN